MSVMASRALGLGPVTEGKVTGAAPVISLVGSWKSGKAALGASFARAGLESGEDVVCINPLGNEPCPGEVIRVQQELRDDSWSGELVTLSGFDLSGPGALEAAIDQVSSSVSEVGASRCLLFSWTDFHIGFDRTEMAVVNRLSRALIRLFKDEDVASLISLDPVSSMDLPVARALSDLLLFVERDSGLGSMSPDGSDESWAFTVESGLPSFGAPDERCVQALLGSKVRRTVLEYLCEIYPETAYQAEMARAVDMRQSGVTGALKGIPGRYAESESLEALGLVEVSGRVGRRIYYRATKEGLKVASKILD